MTPLLTDPRRKRILYRATHRGTKEADAIIGGFFTATIADLAEGRLDDAEALLELPDLDLMEWITGRKPVPARLNGTLLADVMAWEQRRRGET